MEKSHGCVRILYRYRVMAERGVGPWRRVAAVVAILAFVVGGPQRAAAQQGVPTAAAPAAGPPTAPPLVFDGVTVVNVELGKLLPQQRVVVVGNRIQQVERAAIVRRTPGARVVDARGKYLIPGLWDMHVHPTIRGPRKALEIFYPLLLANGVTGIRDASSNQPLDSLIQWRRAMLVGTRVGPPRQLLSGPAIDGNEQGCIRGTDTAAFHACVASPEDARHVVDSLVAAGADLIKTYDLSPGLYLAIAAEARHLHVPFGGHLHELAASEASDSGAAIVDHTNTSGGITADCLGVGTTADDCRPLAERFVRNGTWFTPTLIVMLNFINDAAAADPPVYALVQRLKARASEFWAGADLPVDWLKRSSIDTVLAAAPASPDSASAADVVASQAGFLNMAVAQRVGLPILAGTDATPDFLQVEPPGFALHAELALLAAEGLTPAEALRTATLNPAKLLRATDSLGTVAPGKLADLVLLDANPLEDITNTTTIRAVVANGRYYDRAALDHMLIEARARAKQLP